MNSTWLALYHRLPAGMRSAVASARGYQLRSWRYGPETEDLVAQALERDHWEAARWRAYEQQRLAKILHRAATQVPFYRQYWRRTGGHASSWERLENWPILEKESLRRQPEAFLADNAGVRRLLAIQTSGSTGTPLRLWQGRAMLRAWYALFEARCRRWNAVSLRDRWAILGGHLVAPAASRKPPFWIWNQAFHQLYMSSYHLAPELAPYYLETIAYYGIQYLWGYSSALAALADAAIRLGARLPMKVALTNAEPVYAYQRRRIAAAFQCPVRETYGMAEKVAGASECEHGRLHLWPEAGIFEILPGGDIVSTGLLNEDMPLIRYRVGDRGSLSPEPCPCGRMLPVLAGVEGRSDDVIFTRDGREIGRLDPVLKADLPVKAVQMVQEIAGRLRVRYEPAGDGRADVEALLRGRLRAYLGDMDLEFEALESIPRGPNGKFRSVISRVTRAAEPA